MTEQINITLGTAGHIDHGKTALVKLLTGCETDRLKEEKERGMSIELGFAPCKVGDREVGIVDVPGHEHFIKTMVAGATGIDGVILVIAADDGVMPQTREHLDILTLLGVQHGVVALTKIDRADAERKEFVLGQIEELTKGTFLEGAPVLPISNVTGEGFDGFYAGLVNLVNSIKPKSAEGVFRLPVERAFSVQGYGTVVAGIPVAGVVKVGEEVALLPKGLEGRVNAIQVYGRDGETARAGQCAAINIRHWDHTQIERGDVLAAPGYFEGAEWYLCGLRLLGREGVFVKNGSRVKFHTGTSEVPAMVYVLEGEKMLAGGKGLVQVKLDRQVVAGPTDRFIIRTLSPVETIGGGMVVEALAAKLRRGEPGVKEEAVARGRAVTSETTFVEYALRKAAGLAATAREISRRVKAVEGRVLAVLGELSKAGRAIALGQGLWIHGDTARGEKARITELLVQAHRKAPESAGVRAEELQEAAGLAKEVFNGLAEMLAREGTVTISGGRIALAAHRPQLSEGDRRVVEKVERVYRERLFAPPSPADAASLAELPLGAVERAMKILKERGELVALPEGPVFHREALEEAKRRVSEFITKEGKLESVKFKYIIDTTRKYAIPLLDYLDRVGVTLRVGNTRYLKGK